MNRRFFLTRLGAAATAIGWPLPTKPRQRHDLRTMIDELPAGPHPPVDAQAQTCA